MRYVELFRHTDNDGDELTPDGVVAVEDEGTFEVRPMPHAGSP